MIGKKIATREAYGAALVELGRENPNVVVLDADLSKSTKTAGFAKEYPERFFQMGIAEQDMMGTAAGLATCGKIPFASTFAMFATGRVYDQVRNSIGYPGLNVKIGATHAGLTVGEDGATHQALEDIALMRGIPGMTVIVPADYVEAFQATKAAAAMQGPVYLRYTRGGVPVVFDENYKFTIGKANILREGTDAAVIACGVMVGAALEAADLLAQEGLSIQVINMATIKPLDVEAVVQAAKTTGAVVTAEEHSIIGGLGSAVAEVLGEHYPVPFKRVGVQDVFGQSGSPDELLAHYGLTGENIAQAVRETVARKA
ncbi:MAG: transketolase family protein [Limnochordia bacterium]|jgi:transketolase